MDLSLWLFIYTVAFGGKIELNYFLFIKIDRIGLSAFVAYDKIHSECTCKKYNFDLKVLL